ncbi:MAG: tRNA pseudouridine(55) synthase TruB [Clostridiales bacterium]|nr:tRNA pseudouridine(55) synthase TruB [Clostridiales bacterium]
MTGFININKAAGVSSAREVNIIKRLTGTPCGHMGTLDPMASGVLPVAIGNAARLFDYFLNKHKTYIAVFRFGIDSDTLDTTGNILKEGGYIPSEEEIKSQLSRFEGEILQIPPKYSAKNVCGKRGYELARAGVEFELPPKKVNIYSIKLLKRVNCDEFEFEIKCGGGTYIRSIARDLGAALNTCAVMSALIREESGIFNLKDAVSTEILTAENIKDYIIPTQDVLPYREIYPEESDAKRLFNGLSVKCGLPDGIYKIYTAEREFYGLAEVNKCSLRIKTKLC